MRIGMVCHYGCGGSAQVAVNLAGGLTDRGHAAHLFARAMPFGLSSTAPRVAPHVLATAAEPVTSLLDAQWSKAEIDAFVAKICEVAVRERLEVLHFHYAIPFASVVHAVREALGAQAPATVGTLHGTDVSVFSRQSRVRRQLVPALESLDALTTVSDSHADLAVSLLGLSERPRVIPNFVDLGRFRSRSEPRPRTRPRIVHVSNFRSVKQPESMARIADDVMSRVDAELWLVGDGEQMPAVEAILEDRSASGEVRRLGLRKDVENILPDTDVLLVTSRTESFCLVALEALACGVPVVAARVGGLPEVVEHERNGFLYDPDDEEQAAGYVVRLLTDAALHERMRRAALERASALSATAVVPRYESLYRTVRRVPRAASFARTAGVG